MSERCSSRRSRKLPPLQVGVRSPGFHQDLLETLHEESKIVAILKHMEDVIASDSYDLLLESTDALLQEVYIPNTMSKDDIWDEVASRVRRMIGSGCSEIVIYDPYGLHLQTDDLQHLTALLNICPNIKNTKITLIIDEGKIRNKDISQVINVILDLRKYFPQIEFLHNKDVHDREIIINGKVLHIGASMNGYGSRDFRISFMDRLEAIDAEDRMQTKSKKITEPNIKPYV